MIPSEYVTAMAQNYLVAALWSSIDEDDNPYDSKYGIMDFDEGESAKAFKLCEVFYAANFKDLQGLTPRQAGHDLWLTRCGHGCGFWDRDLGDAGQRLTEAATALGEANVFRFDHGKLGIE